MFLVKILDYLISGCVDVSEVRVCTGTIFSVLFRRKLYQLIPCLLSFYIVSQRIDPLKHEIHLNKVGTFHFFIHTSQGTLHLPDKEYLVNTPLVK